MGQIDILAELVTLGGRDVVDIGSGSGAFSAALAAHGARVTGIEIEKGRVEQARQSFGEFADFQKGRAESLPIDDASADLLCYIHSFHHIPGTELDRAIEEACRVLRNDGKCYMAEPDIGGGMTQIVQPLDDETEIRTHAAAYLDHLPDTGRFCLLAKGGFNVTRRYKDFNAVVDALTGVDPTRREKVPQARAQMWQRFQKVARTVANGFEIDQPVTYYLFQKT